MLKRSNAVVGMLVCLLAAAPALAEEAMLQAFGPGEQMRFRVKYLGMTAGTADITVGAPMKQWGRDVWPLVALARTDDMLGVWPIRDRFISYWESESQRVLGSELHADENRKRRRQRIQLHEDGRTATVVKQKEGEQPYESKHEVPEGSLDIAGATFALRNRELTVGSEYELPIFTGARTFMLKAKVEGVDVMETPLGEREVFRVRVHTEFAGKLQSKRDLIAWLTTDSRHVPVRLEAEFVLGSVIAELTEYQQGQSVAMGTPAGTVKSGG